MAISDSPFKREFVKGLLLQFLRASLYVQVGRLITKGYLTSGQADYILIFMASFLLAIGATVYSAVMRYVRSLALRNSPPNTEPKDIHALAWSILGQILSNNSSQILKG